MTADGITVIGGGLAGCEAAWQAAQRGLKVVLYEMKPHRYSPAHERQELAELVCSNSLRGASLENAVGLLKEEMRRLDSLFMSAADATSVPAGGALAVDRDDFSSFITSKVESHPLITVKRAELADILTDGSIIVASGPLTSPPLADAIARRTGSYLYFYDAIAPIVTADSLNFQRVFRASRYGKGEGDDYLNCPLDREQYESFVAMLLSAEKIPARDFEKLIHFEGCMPVEELAARGLDTLRFGPMKPVGLVDPVSGAEPHAVVQLRMENRQASLFNLVGFQTKLTYPEQKRIFSKIPGLENAEFVRLGSMHRNTYINAPQLLTPDLRLKSEPRIFFAGQITGVEGYVESAATGLLAGIYASCSILCRDNNLPSPLPATTAHGALTAHIANADPRHFQPMNVNFGLFPELGGRVKKSERRRLMAERALNDLEAWKATIPVKCR